MKKSYNCVVKKTTDIGSKKPLKKKLEIHWYIKKPYMDVIGPDTKD